MLVLAVCASPMIFSYLTYYVIKPSGRTNYGTILDPRLYPMPVLHAHLLGQDEKAQELSDYRGKWIMLQIGGGACAEACRKKLVDMRQLRLAQGKEMERIERVWLLTDEQPIATSLLREFDGTHVLRVAPAALNSWLPAGEGSEIGDHIYLIDPRGNLMMRFPKDADPNKIKKDLGKLLRASAIG